MRNLAKRELIALRGRATIDRRITTDVTRGLKNYAASVDPYFGDISRGGIFPTGDFFTHYARCILSKAHLTPSPSLFDG